MELKTEILRSISPAFSPTLVFQNAPGAKSFVDTLSVFSIVSQNID
jgi:hypothetical protein